MSELGADILGVVEAESRPVLYDFNRLILAAVGGTPFHPADRWQRRAGDRCRTDDPEDCIGLMRSHVDDRLPNGFPSFARLPEYEVTTPLGNRLIVMINHLKSKGYGGAAASDAKRKAQAERMKAVMRAGTQAPTTSRS